MRVSETNAEKWHRRFWVAFEVVFWVGLVIAAVLGWREAQRDLVAYAVIFGVGAVVSSLIRRRQARKYTAWASGKGQL